MHSNWFTAFPAVPSFETSYPIPGVVQCYIGELFDHGLDSLAVWLMPWTLMHVVGLVDATSLTHRDWYWVSWALLVSFYVPHLEKYMTGA